MENSERKWRKASRGAVSDGRRTRFFSNEAGRGWSRGLGWAAHCSAGQGRTWERKAAGGWSPLGRARRHSGHRVSAPSGAGFDAQRHPSVSALRPTSRSHLLASSLFLLWWPDRSAWDHLLPISFFRAEDGGFQSHCVDHTKPGMLSEKASDLYSKKSDSESIYFLSQDLTDTLYSSGRKKNPCKDTEWINIGPVVTWVDEARRLRIHKSFSEASLSQNKTKQKQKTSHLFLFFLLSFFVCFCFFAELSLKKEEYDIDKRWIRYFQPGSRRKTIK